MYRAPFRHYHIGFPILRIFMILRDSSVLLFLSDFPCEFTKVSFLTLKLHDKS